MEIWLDRVIGWVSRGGGSIASAVVALLGAVAGGCSGGGPPPFVVDLAGEHRVRDGDDPVFATADFDDSQWTRLEVPSSWRASGLSMPGVRWYRIRFEWPEEMASGGKAVWLGHVGWADETYLNGVRIGATGRLDDVPELAFLPRLYGVPDGALRPGANVLAIRTRGAPLASNGLLSEHLGVGDELALARVRGKILSRAVAVESVIVGFLLFAWLLLAFFPKRGVTGRAAVFLWVFVSLQILHLWLGSATGRQVGLSQDGSTLVRFLAMCIGLSMLWAFIAVIARGRLPRVVIGLMAVAWGIGLVGLVTPKLGFPVVAITSVGTVADVAVIALLVGAVRARKAGAIPALVAYAGALGFIWSTILRSQPFIFGVASYYFGIGWLAVGGLIALARQADVVRKRAQRASDYALAAHTSERTRLARDLHDGLGQMLALLKMQLQRTARKVGDDEARGAVEEGVTQVDATLEEMRRIARDLRPTPMEGRGFGEAVRDYAAAMARRSGIEVVVEGGYDGPLPEGVGDELYRIVQECLANCLKHSQANRVVVSLTDGDGGYSLAVTDDGRGLPERASGAGIGLQTIRERSELLGGSCRFSVPEEGGTRVEVVIPRATD